MSGLEILGVAASAIQVAQVSLAILTSMTSLFNQVRDTPKIAQNRLQQLRTLIDISRLIEKSPQLQTAEVDAILQTCSKDAEELEKLLRGLEQGKSRIKTWIKAIGGVMNETKIIGLLGSLESGKTSLTLCISQIDSTLLHGIDARLDSMGENLEDISQSMRDELPPIRAALENLKIQQHPQPISEKADACLASFAAREQRPFLLQVLRRSKDAGRWIQKSPKFLSWRHSEQSSLLYITASPGCGKTTLAAHICNTIESEISGDAKSVVLYFFFQRSNQEADGTAISALSTIVTQLLQRVPALLPIALHRYDSLSARGHFEWSWENLCTIMDNMFDQISAGLEISIVLDAVDECENNSRQLILDWARGLVDNGHISSAYTARKSITKVLITSRPDESVWDRLYHFPMIEVTDVDTSNDMRMLIRVRMEDFCSRRHLDFEAKESITRFLEDNAHGMFLWVVLVLDELARRDERLSDAVITAKLSRIPMTLLKTYEALIQTSLPSRRNDMWRIIRWLLYSKRGLTVSELETALCLETGISRWHDFLGDLKYLCGSLIRFDGTHGEIHLVHQTARDFLERFVAKAALSDVGNIPMDPISANEHIAKTCVQYLLCDEIFPELEDLLPSSRSWRDYDSMSNDYWSGYPFICYAIENWSSHIHALAIGRPSSILSTMVVQLLSSGERRDGIMRLTCIIVQGSVCSPTRSAMIHLAAYFNLPWLVEICLSQSPDRSVVNSMSDSEDTPLVWASEMGSLDCVKLLLDAGADPNQVEWDGWSALHWAARNGHLEIAKMLLKHGAKVDQQDSKKLMPLDWALGRNNWDVAKVLNEWRIMEESSLDN